jgi:hypothetical protein
VFERGLPALVVAALLLFSIVVEMRSLPAPQRAGLARAAVAQLMAGGLGLGFGLGFVVVLIAVNRIVSHDRRRGYYRFLFAKPLSVPRYYAQSFAINGVGAVATAAVILAAFAALVHPTFPPGALAFVALYYVALGGIMFLISTLTHLDWVVTAAIWGLAQALRAVFPPWESWYGRLFDVILPPAHRVADVGRVLILGDAPSLQMAVTGFDTAALRPGDPAFLAAVLWLLGWGAAAFAAGLVVLRKRSMGA